MSYIAYLNGFNLWLESNALEPVSQLLYFRLLNVFNRAGWPESVQVDNQRIMSMTGQHTEKSAIAARDRLISARLVSYQRGKKGSPGRYALIPFPCNKYSVNNTVENIHCISGQFPVSYPGGNREVNPAPPLQPYKDEEEDAYEEGFPPNPPKGEMGEAPVAPVPSGKAGEPDADFDRFWRAYPRKQAKGAARKAFAKARKKAPLDVMLSAVEKQKTSWDWTKEGGQYIPQPASWLNGERWNDNWEGGSPQRNGGMEPPQPGRVPRSL